MRSRFRYLPLLLAPPLLWHANVQSTQYYQTDYTADKQSISGSLNQPISPPPVNDELPLSRLPQLPVNLKLSQQDPLPGLPQPRRPSNLPQLPLHSSSSSSSPAALSTPVKPMFYLHHHAFDKATKAFFRKYPDPSCPAVLSVTVEEEITDEETGVIYRRRLITIANVAPWWTRRVLPAACVFEEQSLEDRERQVLEVTSRNLTLSHILLATEHSKFVGFTDPTTKQTQTLFVQTGGTKIFAWLGSIGTSMERWAAVHVRQAGVDAILMQEEMMQQEDRLQQRKQ
jgi:hypothetical protein